MTIQAKPLDRPWTFATSVLAGAAAAVGASACCAGPLLLVFWGVSVLALALVVLPLYAPVFY